MAVRRLVQSWTVSSARGGLGRTLAAAIGSVMVMASVAQAPLHAQTTGVTITPKVGFALPAGQFSNYVDAGPTAGLRIGYEFRPRVSIFVDGGFDYLSGAKLYRGLANEISGPDIQLQHYIAGVEGQLVPEDVEQLSILASLGGGILRIDSDPYTIEGETRDWQHTGPTAAAGLEIGYRINPRLALVLDSKLYYSFVEKEKTVDLAAVGPARLDPFSSAITLPITLALRTRI